MRPWRCDDLRDRRCDGGLGADVGEVEARVRRGLGDRGPGSPRAAREVEPGDPRALAREAQRAGGADAGGGAGDQGGLAVEAPHRG